MLDMDFELQLKSILNHDWLDRQVLIWLATFPEIRISTKGRWHPVDATLVVIVALFLELTS